MKKLHNRRNTPRCSVFSFPKSPQKKPATADNHFYENTNLFTTKSKETHAHARYQIEEKHTHGEDLWRRRWNSVSQTHNITVSEMTNSQMHKRTNAQEGDIPRFHHPDRVYASSRPRTTDTRCPRTSTRSSIRREWNVPITRPSRRRTFDSS